MKISKIAFLDSIVWEVDENENIISSYTNKKVDYLLSSSGYPAYPFAPGSYIELQAIVDYSQNIESKRQDSKIKNIFTNFIDSIKSNFKSQKVTKNTIESIKWCYIAFDSLKGEKIDDNTLISFINALKKDIKDFKSKETQNSINPFTNINQIATYKELKDESEYFSKNNMLDKIGFCLPLEQKDILLKDVKKQNVKKYYVAIFAFNAKQEIPHINDAKIVLDISFKVGIKYNKTSYIQNINNKDSKYLRKNYEQLDIYSLNQIENIYSIQDACAFMLRYCKILRKMNVERTAAYRIYPQIAAKIAFIYYIFRIDDIVFLQSIESDCIGNNAKYIKDTFYLSGMEYYDDMLYFVDRIYNLLINGNYYIEKFKALSKLSLTKKYDFVVTFIERINQVLDIENTFHPKVKLMYHKRTLGNYNTLDNTIYINSLTLCCSTQLILETIVHEYRHFYVYYVNELTETHKISHNIVILFLNLTRLLQLDKHINKIFQSTYLMLPIERDAFFAEELLLEKLEHFL